MTAALAAVPAPRVTATEDGLVRITDLAVDDPDVHSLVANSPEPEGTITRILSVGARALGVAQVSVDLGAVERSFAQLTKSLGENLDAAHGQVVGAASELLADPDHGIAARLEAWRRDVDKALDATFNPDLATSALGRLDKLLEQASSDQLRATHRMLDVEVPDSPASRLLASVREQVTTIGDAMTRLGEQVSLERATEKASKLALERSAVKGLAYETLVAQAVTDVAALSGDVAEPVGNTTGSCGSRVGDIVVDVGASETGGVPGRYVLECKDRRLSLKALLAELRAAAENREAAAAIAVVSRPQHAPVSEPFVVFDDLAIVTFDKDDPDPAALRLAAAWARWVVVRATRVDRPSLDAAEIESVIGGARRALSRRTAIRRAHSAAMKRLQEAAAQVDGMHDELAAQFSRLDEAIR